MNRLLLILPLLLVLGCASTHSVSHLRCEGLADPVGIDDRRPNLAWQMVASGKNQVQSAYEILVATEASRLAPGQADVWDSGKVESDDSAHVVYGGPALKALARYYWTVKTWDGEGTASGWAKPAQWTEAMLDAGDWKGQWIGRRATSPNRSGTPNGYHAKEAKDPGEEKWVQLDLGEVRAVEGIELAPARPNNYLPDTPGFGFPLRFKIEAADEPTFGRPRVLVDQTGKDFANPGARTVKFDVAGTTARYVRMTATKNWVRRDGTGCFALAEMRVMSGGKNVALAAVVSAKDSVEAAGWGLRGLNDEVTSDAPAEDMYAAPLLRKTFSLEKAPSRAVVSICGLGYYELFLNGKKVGDHVLDPGFTDFSKRALFVTYDVTGMLRQGGNAAGVMLGNGWYELPTPDLFGNEHAPWTAPPKVLLQLDCDFADGTHQTIVSDGSWKSSTGAIRFQCVRGGETQDMRQEQAGWSEAGFDDGKWENPLVVPAPAGKLVAQHQPPMRKGKDIEAIALTTPKPGVYVYKLAVNTAGWARFRVKGEAGEKITLRFAESLGGNGLVSGQLATHTYGRYQMGEFILAGKKEGEVYEPHFTYHGFQYVQVEGLKEKPAMGDLVGVPVHTDVADAGTFVCSDEAVNRIHEIAKRTYLNNLQSIPTDCPQREKMGWMCDGMVASTQALLNFDAASMYGKWADDMADAQDADGSMPSIVPTQGWSAKGHPGASDFQCPWWGGATVVVPWNVYQATGDTRLLSRHYDAMRRYVDSITARSKDGIVTFGLGDWLEVGREHEGRPVRTPGELTSTAGYAYYANIVSRTANVLGRPVDAARYEKLSKETARAFVARYLRPDNTFGDDTQTAPAIAMSLGLLPADRWNEVAAGLVKNLTVTRKSHLSTGLIGTLYLFRALREMDRVDLGLAAATAPGFPGYVNMLDHGATTLWEDWAGLQSHDHPAFSAVDEFFYASLAGIRATSPGYKTSIIAPPFLSKLTSASATVITPYGPLSAAWKRSESTLTLQVTIPPNTTSTILVPEHKPQLLGSGTYTLSF